MNFGATVEISGPVDANGKQRGVKYVNLGLIQNGSFSHENGRFADGKIRRSNVEGGQRYLDLLNNSIAPWYNQQNRFGGTGLWSSGVDPVSPAATVLPQFKITDRPNNWPGADKLDNGSDPLATVYISGNFFDFLCAATTYAANGSQNVFDTLEEGAWHFYGSGSVAITPAGAGVWTAFSTSRNGGDVNLAPPSPGQLPPVVVGPSMNWLGLNKAPAPLITFRTIPQW